MFIEYVRSASLCNLYYRAIVTMLRKYRPKNLYKSAYTTPRI